MIEKKCVYIIGKICTYGVISKEEHDYLVNVDLNFIQDKEIREFIERLKNEV